MMVAHEFGDLTLERVKALGPEEVGWWLAFFKYKNKLENTPTKSATKSKPTKSRRAK